ncbi:MAG: threonine ammonia-lyase, biosynthetic, partial [Pseudomonadales bacterium]|nr:threonine ammonia-lyase, biosynthetic [Pseudomonadales bacterium]
LGKINISEFNYRYSDSNNAQVFAGVQIGSASDREGIVQKLCEKGYATEDLSDNEMAKLHIRHMVGGRYPEIGEELLYRVEFPERPGALMGFLISLGEKWNISLFHYRNHGAAYGRVLVGFQAAKKEEKDIEAVLKDIGYRFYSETDNPAYQLFLK